MGPYFSVIIPLYNRATTINRAIDSCLAQSFEDFEIIVVDDGSTDHSASIVQTYSDPRLSLVRHPVNRGPCPSRNSAILKARGQWFIMLDSDFSLLDQALRNLFDRTQKAPPDVGNVASRCLWDRPWRGGNVTPLPGVPIDILDYVGYLRWSDSLIVSEYFNCIRRTVFDRIKYPESRAWETSFHLDLAFYWRLHIAPDIVVEVHTDAPNRLTEAKGRWAMDRTFGEIGDKWDDMLKVWQHHGDAIGVHAPRRHKAMLREAGRLNLLLGSRRMGSRYMVDYLRTTPSDLRAWAILGVGLLSRRFLGWTVTCG